MRRVGGRARAVGLGAVVAFATVGALAGAAKADAPSRVGWWSKLNPGLPVALPAPFVPDGGLYVANDPSGPTAISALRYAAVDGTPATLTLQFAGSPVGTPEIVACRVTSAWAPAANGPMSQAPAYDCADAVNGAVAADGTTVSWQLPGAFATMGAIEVALVPAPGSGPFQAPFSKPSPASLVPGVAPVAAEGAAPAPESEAAPSFDVAVDAGAPLELPASGGSFDLPPPPSPPSPSSAVGTPTARGGQLSLPALPRVVAPARSSRSDQVLAFSLLAAVAAALWLLADRPVRAPRLIGGVHRVGGAQPAAAGGRARGGRVGAEARVRIGGIGRFARPRTTLPHRL